MENYWDNDDGNMSFVKTEPVDIVTTEYNESGTNEQVGFINYGNEEIAQYGDSSVSGEYHFKQEGIDTGEDMEYRMQSYQDQGYYPQDPGAVDAAMGGYGNWQPYRNGFMPNVLMQNYGQQMLQQQQQHHQQQQEEQYHQQPFPSTSDISIFADKRVQQLYPCPHCDYVGNHPKLLNSHINNRHTKSVIYQCPHCPYNSTISRSTKDHVESKHFNEDEKAIEIKRKCDFCDYSASNATVLKNHMNKHTAANQHQCPFCEFNTIWEGYLKMHIKRKHSEQAHNVSGSDKMKEYPCQYCDYKALTPSSLKLHTNKHTREQEHQCPYCPYKTVWTTYIKSHINNKHLKPEKSSANVPKEFACSFCDYKAKNSTLLKQHVNKHTRENVHQCPHCPFTTLWITYMKLHVKRKHSVKTETGETAEKREFQCNYCEYKAISASHLKIHENKHTKAVEYKCEQCDFKTTWYGYLKLHTKRKHSIKQEDSQQSSSSNATSSSKTTFPCKFCPYKAINLSTLKVHQNKHTREVLYDCPQCEFKTTWRAYLRMHIEKHNNARNFKTRQTNRSGGVKSFPCQYCDYKATQLSALKLHVNSKHTRSVLYKCPKCDYQCAVHGNLKMHIRRRHGIKPDPDGKYRCNQCEHVSEDAGEFKLHLNEKHDVKIDVDELKSTENEKIYSCQHCSYRTYYPQVMKKHVNKHTRQNVIQCPHCPYATVWNHYMKIHIRRHSEPKTGRQRFTRPNTDLSRLFPCQFCDHRSLSLSSLKDHVNSVHTRAILHKCPYCEHKCSLKGNLRGHIRRKHPTEFVEIEKKYSCERCDFKTSIMRNLKIHLKKEHDVDHSLFKLESGEFQCQFCDYKARSYYSLKIHTNKHTQENSYHCPQCEFVTRWPNYLKKHVEQHALNKRKVTCVYCDYRGCSTFRLRKHIEELHKISQHYPCPKTNCDFKTLHYPSLRIHLKGSIHADSRRRSHMSITRNFSYKYKPNEGRYFACDHCDYASKTQGNLDLHIKNKHDRKVVMKCGTCNYRTTSKNYLNRHLKIKHANNGNAKKDEVKEEEEEDDEELMVDSLSLVACKYDENPRNNNEDDGGAIANFDGMGSDEDDDVPLLSYLKVKLEEGDTEIDLSGCNNEEQNDEESKKNGGEDDGHAIATERCGRRSRRSSAIPYYVEESSTTTDESSSGIDEKEKKNEEEEENEKKPKIKLENDEELSTVDGNEGLQCVEERGNSSMEEKKEDTTKKCNKNGIVSRNSREVDKTNNDIEEIKIKVYKTEEKLEEKQTLMLNGNLGDEISIIKLKKGDVNNKKKKLSTTDVEDCNGQTLSENGQEAAAQEGNDAIKTEKVVEQ